MQARTPDPQDVDNLNSVMRGKSVIVEHRRLNQREMDRFGILQEFKRTSGMRVSIILTNGPRLEFEPDTLLDNGVAGTMCFLAGRVRVILYDPFKK